VILATIGYRRFPPSIFGKLTTTLQILLVFVVLLVIVTHSSMLTLVRQGLVYLVAGFTVFSGFHYSIVVARRLSHSHDSNAQ
jgi:phosphatidylglycerophosphate synthase